MAYLAIHDNSANGSFDFAIGDTWINEFQLGDNETPEPTFKLIAYNNKAGLVEPLSVFGGAIMFFANEAFKDILEKLEPGVHAFVPFELRYGTKKDFTSHQYYAVRPGQMFDAVDTAVSELEWFNEANGMWGKKDGVPLTLDPEKIKGKHLWGRPLGMPMRFLSDELRNAIEAAGLTTSWAFEKQLARGQAIAAE